jgi:membrane-bound ClpP family serine protease
MPQEGRRMQRPSALRDGDLVLSGLTLLGLVGVVSLIVGVLWPGADGSLVPMGVGAIALAVIGVHVVLAGLAAARRASLDRAREFERRHGDVARDDG